MTVTSQDWWDDAPAALAALVEHAGSVDSWGIGGWSVAGVTALTVFKAVRPLLGPIPVVGPIAEAINHILPGLSGLKQAKTAKQAVAAVGSMAVVIDEMLDELPEDKRSQAVARLKEEQNKAGVRDLVKKVIAE